jgi:hypothetical protein
MSDYRDGYRITEATETDSPFDFEVWSDRHPTPDVPEYIHSRHDSRPEAVAHVADMRRLEGEAKCRS